jgi:predicted PurR-regulated permease PerM
MHLLDYLNPQALIERLSSSADQALQLLITGIGAVLSAGSQLALVLLFAVLMLASRRQIRSSLEHLAIKMHEPSSEEPAADFPVGLQVIDDTSWMIERFLVMRFLIVLIIGAADTLILYFAGVKYAILLGGLLGIMTLVPAIGFIVGLIPALLVSIAMGHSALRTALMASGLFVMSIIEGNVLTPAMVGRSINLNALSTFVGLFAGGMLWGIWGMLLSVPILGALRIVFSAIPALEPLGELLAGGPQNGRGPGLKGEAGAGKAARDKKTEAA